METTIIEVNGIKMEIDLRQAKVVDHYKVGDKIKILKKKWNDSWESYVGVIIGFDGFERKPTIIIAYIEDKKVVYAYFNSESKDVEIVRANENDLPFSKATVVESLEKEIQKKTLELEEANFMKNNFIKFFGKYFEETNSVENKVA